MPPKRVLPKKAVITKIQTSTPVETPLLPASKNSDEPAEERLQRSPSLSDDEAQLKKELSISEMEIEDTEISEISGVDTTAAALGSIHYPPVHATLEDREQSATLRLSETSRKTTMSDTGRFITIADITPSRTSKLIRQSSEQLQADREASKQRRHQGSGRSVFSSFGIDSTRASPLLRESPINHPLWRSAREKSHDVTQQPSEAERSTTNIKGTAGEGSGIPRMLAPPLIHPATTAFWKRNLTRTEYAIDASGNAYYRHLSKPEDPTHDQYRSDLRHVQYDYGMALPGRHVRIIEEKECLGGLCRWDEAHDGYITGHEWQRDLVPQTRPSVWHALAFYYQSHE